MNKVNKIFSAILLITLSLIGFIFWKNYIPHSAIPGEYINNNTAPILEGPGPIQYGAETLVLFENGTFESKTWGSGTYTISGSVGKSVKLRYTYEFGEAGYNLIISKSIFGKLRLWLSTDLNFYFEKVK